MEYQIVTNEQKWTEILKLFPQNDIYFDYKYHDLYINNEHECIEGFLFSSNGESFFLPYIKKEILGRDGWYDFETVYGYTGPLITTDNIVFLKNAWSKFESVSKKNKIVCGIIRFNPYLNNADIWLPDYMEKSKIRDIVCVNINKPYEDIRRGFNRGTKSDINKAIRTGLTTKIMCGEEAYIFFMNNYIKHMKRIKSDSYYYFSEKYFIKLNEFGEKKSNIHCVFLEDKMIAGLIMLYGDQICHPHLNWSLPELKDYKTNKFIYSEAMRLICNNNYKYFNFGGGLTNSSDDNLYLFKRHFSRETREFYLGKIVIDIKKYNNLCEEWEINNNSVIKNKFGNYFLKYRYNNL